MKIVFFSTQLYALTRGRTSGYGGAETELWNVVRKLARMPDLDLKVVVLTDEIHKPSNFDGVTLVPSAPSPYLTTAVSWIKRRGRIGKYYLELLNVLRRQDGEFYFTKLASVEACIVWLASRLSRARFGFRIEHDWETNLSDLESRVFNGRTLGARIFLYCLRRADLIIVQTTNQQKALESNYNLHSVIIPNGHNIPLKEQLAPYKDRQYVMWVGRSHPMKRAHLFLELARLVPTIPFIIIMAPSTEFPDIFESTELISATLENVRFIPGATECSLTEYYSKAICLVLTSEAEGFSNVAIEALKHGTPVISLDHNPNNIFTHAEYKEVSAGFYTHDDLNLTSNLISHLASNNSFWVACHNLAHSFAASNFDLDKIADQYHDLFYSVE